MKTRMILFTLLLCFVGAGVCLADDPMIGTWKLNEAKSKIGAGPKNTTVIYEAAGDSVKVTTDGTDGDGSLRTASGQASTTAKTTRSQGIRILIRGPTRKSTTIRWRSPTRRATKLRLAVVASYRPMARPARSPSREPIRRARSTPAQPCTTSNRGSYSIAPATAMPFRSFPDGRA